MMKLLVAGNTLTLTTPEVCVGLAIDALGVTALVHWWRKRNRRR